MALFLYSTNPWIKWYINNRWRSNKHFVWCCDVFDPNTVSQSHYGSLIPLSSSPHQIYKDVSAAVKKRDKHDPKISHWRISMLRRTDEWLENQVITKDDSIEIVAALKSEDLYIWRPELYVIPLSIIQNCRVAKVPPHDRAGLGDEYQISDLDGNEFERISLNES